MRSVKHLWYFILLVAYDGITVKEIENISPKMELQPVQKRFKQYHELLFLYKQVLIEVFPALNEDKYFNSILP